MAAPICDLVHVTKRYASHVVLDNFTLQIEPREMVAIVGPSGSGKTTVLNIVGLLESPDSGQVRLFGRASPRIGSAPSMDMLRRRIGYLFQNGALMDDATVGENLDVALAYTPSARGTLEPLKTDALTRVGLGGVSLRMKAYGLSGGEQQRLAIARLLLKPCELILADEPTGSLDATNRDDVLNTLRHLN